MATVISRRKFMVRSTVAGAGLLVGLRFSGPMLLSQESEKAKKKAPVNPFDAYIHVKPDGKISLIVAKSEMGQGIKTGLAMILAEEAAVDFNSVSVEQAETRPDIYAHMGTGGSGSTMENYMPLRRAGATVRELMITAAAQKWNVSKNGVRGQKCCRDPPEIVAARDLWRTGRSGLQVASARSRKSATER